MTIYVVRGTTGEYSDRDEWAVCAFTTEALATDHVVKATARAKELEATRQNRDSIERGANPYDPGMQMDYTGTMYFVDEVELLSESMMVIEREGK